MKDLYAQSWDLYKCHTEAFTDDVEYYAQFIDGHHSLELFAGFGRVTNPLTALGHTIDTVELSEHFAKFIKLPVSRNHVGDVLTFQPRQKFNRIYAAYNSFCLLTTEVEIHRFFDNLAAWMPTGGRASLNYYHTDYWAEAVESQIAYRNNVMVKYHSSFDLSARYTDKRGVWIDHYSIDNKKYAYRYPTRVYESGKDLAPYLDGTGLRLVDSIENFGRNNVTEPGWIDFILEKDD